MKKQLTVENIKTMIKKIIKEEARKDFSKTFKTAHPDEYNEWIATLEHNGADEPVDEAENTYFDEIDIEGKKCFRADGINGGRYVYLADVGTWISEEDFPGY